MESPRTPLGVLGFQAESSLEQELQTLREVLIADLKRSLAFQLTDLSHMPLPLALNPDEVKKIAGERQEIILSGKVKKEGERIKMDLSLFNGKTGKWIWETVFAGSIKDLRPISHRASDKIVLQLTGEPGIAESEIAFVSDSKGSKEIYRMDYDGFNARLMTLNHTINLFPRWSPDGKKISYTSYIDRNPDIWIMDVTTSKRWKVTSGGLNLSAVWFPDGKRIVFARSLDGQTQLFTSTEEGKNVQRLTFSQGNDLSPSFSPTGAEIVFNSDRGGSPQIYIMNQDGSNVRRLTFEGDYNTTPSWSPKGDWIAYTCRADGKLHVCLISADGQRKMNLSSILNVDDECPVWSPDGRHLTFSSNRDGRQSLYMMTSEGTEIEKITQSSGNFINPAWSPVRH
ncbi:MAG: Tol-Pal system beta propeller repeat protein TolB [Nitrospirae bacterium]|nr:Tol-Pal system beta propeller repeat protein TolB [Nitrospirota bacterium]MBI3593330.1 Tol-Pal system beta propeller repeat protein TolB [Nitrospirota bacterium]